MYDLLRGIPLIQVGNKNLGLQIFLRSKNIFYNFLQFDSFVFFYSDWSP